MLSRYKNWLMWQIKGRGYLLKKLKRSMTKVRTITPKALTRNSQNYQTSLKLEIIKIHKWETIQNKNIFSSHCKRKTTNCAYWIHWFFYWNNKNTPRECKYLGGILYTEWSFLYVTRMQEFGLHFVDAKLSKNIEHAYLRNQNIRSWPD